MPMKKVPKGMHMMPDGKLMKDSEHSGMAKMTKKKVPKGMHMMPDGKLMKDSAHKGMKKSGMKATVRAMPKMKMMECDSSERKTIPKTMKHPHGIMFHHIVNPGMVAPGPGGGSPYEGKRAVPVRSVGAMQGPELQSSSDPLRIRTSGFTG